MLARYESTCGECGGLIVPGVRVKKTGEKWKHAECPFADEWQPPRASNEYRQIRQTEHDREIQEGARVRCLDGKLGTISRAGRYHADVLYDEPVVGLEGRIVKRLCTRKKNLSLES